MQQRWKRAAFHVVRPARGLHSRRSGRRIKGKSKGAAALATKTRRFHMQQRWKRAGFHVVRPARDFHSRRSGRRIQGRSKGAATLATKARRFATLQRFRRAAGLTFRPFVSFAVRFGGKRRHATRKGNGKATGGRAVQVRKEQNRHAKRQSIVRCALAGVERSPTVRASLANTGAARLPIACVSTLPVGHLAARIFSRLASTVSRQAEQQRQALPPRPLAHGGMCAEQRTDLKAAQDGKISWREYFAKWARGGLSL